MRAPSLLTAKIGSLPLVALVAVMAAIVAVGGVVIVVGGSSSSDAGIAAPVALCGVSQTQTATGVPVYAIGFTRRTVPIGSPQDDPTAVVVEPGVGAAPRVVVSGAYDASWSPDGRYVATQNGHGILVTPVSDPATSKGVPGTRLASDLFAWSPNSQLIAEQELSDVIVTNLSGSVHRVVGQDSADVTGSGEDISWSPNNAYVTYIGSNGTLGSRYVVVASAATGVDHTVAQADSASSPPSWSPDGNRFAFDRAGTIWTTEPKGGSPHKLVGRGQCYNTAPAWSPDGRSVAFLCGQTVDSLSADTNAVCVVGASGGKVTQLTPFDYHLEPLSWSPDSKWIAAVENVSLPQIGSAHTSIAAVPAAGGPAVDVSGTRTFDSDPSWVQPGS